MTKIKICGLFRPEDADYVNLAMPDYVGFVFAKDSKRHISFDRARDFRVKINPKIKTVGVFVNSPLEDIVSIYQDKTIQIIQLHGEEDERYLRSLRNRLPEAEIWQAFLIGEKDDFKNAKDSLAHRVLLDSGRGSGNEIDRNLLPPILGSRYILAGGLTPKNLKSKAKLRPFAVDLSSGVEFNGIKNKDKILAAVQAIRKVV